MTARPRPVEAVTPGRGVGPEVAPRRPAAVLRRPTVRNVVAVMRSAGAAPGRRTGLSGAVMRAAGVIRGRRTRASVASRAIPAGATPGRRIGPSGAAMEAAGVVLPPTGASVARPGIRAPAAVSGRRTGPGPSATGGALTPAATRAGRARPATTAVIPPAPGPRVRIVVPSTTGGGPLLHVAASADPGRLDPRARTHPGGTATNGRRTPAGANVRPIRGLLTGLLRTPRVAAAERGSTHRDPATSGGPGPVADRSAATRVTDHPVPLRSRTGVDGRGLPTAIPVDATTIVRGPGTIGPVGIALPPSAGPIDRPAERPGRLVRVMTRPADRRTAGRSVRGGAAGVAMNPSPGTPTAPPNGGRFGCGRPLQTAGRTARAAVPAGWAAISAPASKSLRPTPFRRRRVQRPRPRLRLTGSRAMFRGRTTPTTGLRRPTPTGAPTPDPRRFGNRSSVHRRKPAPTDFARTAANLARPELMTAVLASDLTIAEAGPMKARPVSGVTTGVAGSALAVLGRGGTIGPAGSATTSRVRFARRRAAPGSDRPTRT